MVPNLSVSEDEQILYSYEVLRRQALSAVGYSRVGFEADILRNKGFWSWAHQAKSCCERVIPSAKSLASPRRIDDEDLKVVLTDLALRLVTQEDASCLTNR